jgi:triacylglycerol lipase
MQRLPVAFRTASWLDPVASVRPYAGNQTTICRSASSRRHLGAYAPLCRQFAPTDARIKGLGKEIADEYALVRDSYSMFSQGGP